MIPSKHILIGVKGPNHYTKSHEHQNDSADDARFIREVVRQLVTSRGFEVVGEAEDGNGAVELALRHRPDIVLMDLVMPIKSGIAATREIIQAWPEAKIVGFFHTSSREFGECRNRSGMRALCSKTISG